MPVVVVIMLNTQLILAAMEVNLNWSLNVTIRVSACNYILSSYCAIFPGQGCNSSGVSFFANFSSVSSGQQLVSGIAVMCINRKLVPLCDEDDDFDSDDIDLVCTSMGYDGKSRLNKLLLLFFVFYLYRWYDSSF